MPIYKTLDHFYNRAGSALSNPAPPNCQTLWLNDMTPHVVNKLELRKPVYFGTVTMDPTIYGYMSREQQTNIILLEMKEYCKQLHDTDQCIYTLEYHKDHRPHIHMLTTGTIKLFRNSFKKLGSRNTHVKSYQRTVNILKVFAYMCKHDPLIGETKKIECHLPRKEELHLTIYVKYNSCRHPLKGYIYTPRCRWLPPIEDEIEY